MGSTLYDSLMQRQHRGRSPVRTVGARVDRVSRGGAGSARPCSCRGVRGRGRRRAAPRRGGHPSRYCHCRLANFQVSSEAPAVQGQLTKRALRRPAVRGRLRPRRRAFPRVGPPLRRPARRGQDPPRGRRPPGGDRALPVHARFAEFTSLIHQIQSTFDPGSPESKHAILDPWSERAAGPRRAGLAAATPWVRDILYLIINHATARRLRPSSRPTISWTVRSARQAARREGAWTGAATPSRPLRRTGSWPPGCPPCSSAASTRWHSRWRSTPSRISAGSTRSTGPINDEEAACDRAPGPGLRLPDHPRSSVKRPPAA